MKEGWTYKCLVEVCDVYQPQTIASKDLLSDGQYLVYGANGVIGKYNKYNHEESEVLLTCRGATCGNINISAPYSWINGNAMVVHPKSNNLTKPFIVFLLKTLDYSVVITGAAQPQITRASLSKISIPVPPLAEQERIVAYLDTQFAKIDAMKANAAKALAEAKALFQAALTEAMTPKEGWNINKLDDVCNFRSGFAFKSNKFTEEGEAIIRISDIQCGKVDETNMVFFHLSDYSEDLQRFIVYPNDILIAMSGGTTGKIGINKTNKKFYLNQRVGVFREDKRLLDHSYLFYYLNTKSQESLKIAAGAAQPNLSTEQIKNFEVPLPPLPEQECIVTRLDALSAKVAALEGNYTQTVAECDALKQALLREVFE